MKEEIKCQKGETSALSFYPGTLKIERRQTSGAGAAPVTPTGAGAAPVTPTGAVSDVKPGLETYIRVLNRISHKSQEWLD